MFYAVWTERGRQNDSARPPSIQVEKAPLPETTKSAGHQPNPSNTRGESSANGELVTPVKLM